MAAAGIICLGLVPTLGGPDRPLHWAMTAGMVGFGVLLQARHWLRRAEPPLATVPASVALRAGRVMLVTVGIIALIVTVVMATRWNGRVAPLSLALPAAGLAWLTLIGLRVLRHGRAAPTAEAPSNSDRPSRRPSNWDALSGASGQGKATSSHLSL